MKKYLFLSIIAIFFIGCSSKDISLNERLNSFSVNKNIYISGVPQKVDSNFSIGLGTSSYLKNIGIHLGTVIVPKIQNNDGLDLDMAISSNSINLQNLVHQSFEKNFNNDDFYKNYYVPFGGKFSMNIKVLSYRLNSNLFSDKYQINFVINVDMRDDKNKIIYEKRFNTKSLGKENQYLRDEILSDYDVLIKSINLSLDNVVLNIIEDMKKN